MTKWQIGAGRGGPFFPPGDLIVNVGGSANPLDLTSSVSLVSAVLNYYSSTLALIYTQDFVASGYPFSDPWDGYFPRSDHGVGGTALAAVARIEFLLTVEAEEIGIPEPATLLLLGTGLAAAGVRRRMKKRS